MACNVSQKYQLHINIVILVLGMDGRNRVTVLQYKQIIDQ